jgi:hypothetical protein
LVQKILLAALVFVVVGLVLLIYPDPQFRLIFSGGTAPGFSTTRFTVGNGTGFPRNFTGTGGFNFTRGAGTGAARAALLGFNAASIIESLLGVGLISVGVVLIVVEMFLSPSKPR